MNTAAIVGLAFEAAQKVAGWITTIIEDRSKREEQIRAEALVLVDHLVKKALAFRARVEEDDAAALREFAEAGRTLGTPTPAAVVAVARPPAAVTHVGETCPGCDPHTAHEGACAGLDGLGSPCPCDVALD